MSVSGHAVLLGYSLTSGELYSYWFPVLYFFKDIHSAILFYSVVYELLA
jgi:hypothetical protein